MKFGNNLQNSIYPPWENNYVQYNVLKKQLEAGLSKPAGWTERDEGTFGETIDSDLTKVFNFVNAKFEELQERTTQAEVKVATFQEAYNQKAIETLTSSISEITDEVNQLSKYCRINYAGFLKIVKKHDKNVPYKLRPVFMVQLKSRAFYNVNFDSLVVRLSKLYHSLGAQSLPFGTPSLPFGTPSLPFGTPSLPFGTPITPSILTAMAGKEGLDRKSFKFWVHPDNVMEVKTTVLKHLPVILYTPRGPNTAESLDPSLSSVYLDNTAFDLYSSKLERQEGAQAIRLRWYGSPSNNEIYVERKIHHEINKFGEYHDRFTIKEKYVDAFLKGEYTMDRQIAKLREQGVKSPAEVERFEEMVKDVQRCIVDMKLKPVLRTVYNRTAFQIPGDKRVRLSLDTDLCMIREDNLDNTTRSGNHWRRMDIDYPMGTKTAYEQDMTRFNYAILEVKLELPAGKSTPGWVEELMNSHLVESAETFSKYVHGVAVLLESHVALLPFWLAQLEKDSVRNTDSMRGQLAVNTPSISRANSTADIHSINSRRTSIASGSESDNGASTRSLSKGKQKSMDIIVDNQYGQQNGQYSSHSKPASKASSIGKKPFGFKGLGGVFRKSKGKDSRESSPLLGPSDRYDSVPQIRIIPPKPKKVVGPLKVEAKVFFANERTFLKWMNFAVLLGALGVGLFNAGDNIGRFAGIILAVTALITLVYSIWLYEKRLTMLRNKDPGPYDEPVMPTLMCVCMLTAISLNFYLKSTVKSKP
ncbi:VTC domain-containing protein [Gamsiella multidivaricata]|uniref:VTC domain-containing protein n=1 Tax=Gamsiella multidivaricata TaxID=101098 RepID=UPI00221E85E5|nr:VTC domain-containing protein [Gamsiella multidivaricata]KAG0368346.1 vacuolar transporter chaperone [Gamsiella multidivaricata]KAI7830490.1 VTC domain-containing protein [Gamsiella multidivaricata]